MSFHPEDRMALIIMAEVLKEHLQAGEDSQDLGILSSDRMQSVINILTTGADRDKNKEHSDNDREI